ncbi:unnamed protein product [Paramecium sonneborni]|uniref:Transmembrane protein n=1 Tax=Paramecium sonneborni TaxID=65129 RepID=A0A8S1RRD5_9CILI|nr:unnamed protein product [Paramecium sonneborni]
MNLSKQQEDNPMIQKGNQKQVKYLSFDMANNNSIYVFSLLNKPQMILGIRSIFLLLVSLVLSHQGYNFYKKDKKDEQMPLKAWRIRVQFMLLVFCQQHYMLVVFLVFFRKKDIHELQWLLREYLQIQQKEAFIIVLSQLRQIIVNLVLLTDYGKVSYHLEFQPMHFCLRYQVDLSLFVVLQQEIQIICHQNQVVQQIRKVCKKLKEHITSIFWTCLIGLIFSLFTLFEQRSIQQVFPKMKFYFLSFLLIMGASEFSITNSLNFYTLQVNQFSIGCPTKYRTVNIQGSNYFDMYCSQDEVGIVWENEVDKQNSEKRNQLTCMNLSCYLETIIFYSILTAFLGFIAAGHCFVIALQEPNVIKAGSSVYSQTQQIVQIVLALFSIILDIYFCIKFNQKVHIKMPDLNPYDSINLEPKYFPELSALSSISQCQEVRDQHNKAF